MVLYKVCDDVFSFKRKFKHIPCYKVDTALAFNVGAVQVKAAVLSLDKLTYITNPSSNGRPS